MEVIYNGVDTDTFKPLADDGLRGKYAISEDKKIVLAAARAIKELCAEDRETMRKRCREYAEVHFDKRDCFAKYIALYEKLINKSK